MAFNDLLLRTLNGESVERTPVWLMRQAGRYMPEYREVRSRVSFLELCKTPDLATKVTLQPIDAFNLDSAILFSDIMVPVEPMGLDLEFNPGPKIGNPVRSEADADKLRVIDAKADVPYVMETVKKLVSKLNVPLIGFSGAPFTLACYMVEGQGSKNFMHVKRLMHDKSKAWELLMQKTTDSTINYLQAQVDAGCPVVQMFDTWAGIVSPYEYEEFIFPYVQQVVEGIKGAHFIYFAKDSGAFYPLMKNLKCTGMGVDWKTRLADADRLLDHNFVLQGNLDPAMLLTDPDTIERYSKIILDEGKTLKGHIFNLGHGIVPETPPEHVKHLVEFVREYSAR